MGVVNYEMLFADSGELRAWGRSTFERLDARIRDRPALSVQPGEYSFEDVGVEFRSNRSAALSGSLEVGAGEFWSGRQRLAGGGLRWRLNAHLAVSTTLTRNVVTLPEGSFTGDLVGLRVDWSFTPRMFLNAFVQYNGETDMWLSNVRYNLIHRPLSDIYVVWNETHSPGISQARAVVEVHAPHRVLSQVRRVRGVSASGAVRCTCDGCGQQPCEVRGCRSRGPWEEEAGQSPFRSRKGDCPSVDSDSATTAECTRALPPVHPCTARTRRTCRTCRTCRTRYPIS